MKAAAALTSATTCMLLGSARAFVAAGAHSGVSLRTIASTSSRLAMVLAEGDKLPMGATFKKIVDGKPSDVPAADIFAGKKVVVCGVPGAMTPTCSESHLPGFISLVDEFKSKGVDTVACISVNDPFVMSAWGKKLDVGDKVMMLADGGADFAKAIGAEMDTKDFGGIRLRRLAMLVNDGVIQKIGIEEGGGYTDASDAKTILAAL